MEYSDREDVMFEVRGRIYYELSRKTIESFVFDIWKENMDAIIDMYKDRDNDGTPFFTADDLIETEFAGVLRVLPKVTAKFLKEKISNEDCKFPFDIKSINLFKLRQFVAMSEYLRFSEMPDNEILRFFDFDDEEV